MLTRAALWLLVSAAGAEAELQPILVATMCVEAPAYDASGQVVGTNPDAVGDGGAAWGPYQMHDDGAGAGIPIAQRKDAAWATAYMLEHEFRPAIREGRARGYSGEELAVWTYMRAERPYGYRSPDDPGWESAAAARFRAEYRRVVAETPTAAVPAGDVAAAVLAAGYSMVGTPYALPPGPGTTDCSLFVLQACASAGVPFPAGVRTAEQIRQACELVTSADGEWDNSVVRRGDLLLFEGTYAGNPGERATHIGFALLGGRMLDANDGRGDVGETVLSDWWQARLFEVRRPPQYAMAPTPAAPEPAEAEPTDLAAQLAAEREWGTALLVEIRHWREALEHARQLGAWDEVDAVIATLRRNEG